MLPFLISMRFWRKQQKGVKLERVLGNGQLHHLFGVSERTLIQSRGSKYIGSKPGGLKGPCAVWGWEGGLTFSVMYLLCPSANFRA